MTGVIGIRREDLDIAEQRAPLTPEQVGTLLARGIRVLVEPAANRVFRDEEYRAAGAVLTEDLTEANIVFGAKEVPLDRIGAGQTFCFFSHTIKGQAHNMPMLRRFMERRATLFDYERVVDEKGRRLIFFGRWAGIVGMVRSLWAWGQRMRWEGVETPFADIRRAYEYGSLEEALRAMRSIGRRIAVEGLPAGVVPFVCGFAGYGNVARGAQEVFDLLPTREIDPDDLPDLVAAGPTPRSRHEVYRVVFREEHIVRPRDPGGRFVLDDYYRHPEVYESSFDRFYPLLSILINANYWAPCYPRLVTFDLLRGLHADGNVPRPRVIGDIGCDIRGAIECTVRTSTLEDPVYVCDPGSEVPIPGWEGKGPVVLAVDRLPNEFAREATQSFGEALLPFLPRLAGTDLERPFEDLDLPPPFMRALVVHTGDLTPDYRYLASFLDGAGGPDR